MSKQQWENSNIITGWYGLLLNIKIYVYLRSRRLPIYPRSGYLCASDGDANKAVNGAMFVSDWWMWCWASASRMVRERLMNGFVLASWLYNVISYIGGTTWYDRIPWTKEYRCPFSWLDDHPVSLLENAGPLPKIWYPCGHQTWLGNAL